LQKGGPIFKVATAAFCYGKKKEITEGRLGSGRQKWRRQGGVACKGVQRVGARTIIIEQIEKTAKKRRERVRRLRGGGWKRT